jgi:putative oxidoreductase
MTFPLFLKSFLTHPYLALAFRIYIGVIFIYASMYKIIYTAEFAETIASYQIVPYWAVNSMAIVFPWIELVSGIMLIAGIRTKLAAVTIAGLLLLFASAILINLIKGSAISCGCFHYSLNEVMSWWTLLRDLIWLGMTFQVFFFDRAFHFERRLRFSRIVKEIP